MLNKYYQIKKANGLGDETTLRTGWTIDNRLSYLSRWGLLAAFLTFFGWGKQVEIDPAKLADPDKQIKEICLSGMRANTVLAGASLIFCLIFDNMILVFFFSTIFMANLQISLFGLLPIQIWTATHCSPRTSRGKLKTISPNTKRLLLFSHCSSRVFFSMPSSNK
ncbi:MAG: hypothetical protein LBO05_07410 [Deltaproteobacteria bacterium]|nr:hypothetical protein [Deltaproteobacteria bacterium]